MNANSLRSPRLLPLESPQFRVLWITQAFGNVSFRMFHMALLWAIIEAGSRYDTAAAGAESAAEGGWLRAGARLSLFLLASALPPVVLAKHVGGSVEARGPERSMRFALAALLLINLCALICVTQVNAFVPLFCLLVCVACASAVVFAHFEPGLAKGIGRSVSQEHLGQAAAWQTATQSLAGFGGAVAGASLIAAVGVPGVLAIAGLLMLLGLGQLALSGHGKRAESVASSGSIEASAASGSPVAEVTQESVPLRLRYAREVRLLMGFGLVNFFGTPLLVLLPLLVKERYGGQVSLLGWLEGSMWIGILLGSIFAGKYAGRFAPLRVPFPAVLSMGLVLLGGLYGAQQWHVAAHAIALVLFGLCLGVNNTAMLGHFQSVVLDADKGRFFAMMQAVIGAVFPIGYLVFGMAADVLGSLGASYAQALGLALAAWVFPYLVRNPAAHAPPAPLPEDIQAGRLETTPQSVP